MVDISFIVPVFNTEKYLEACIRSILRQNIENFELILINDGSSDKSADICHKYAKKYENITFLSQSNSGQSVARNKGIEYAKGEYLFFVDSDDQLCKIEWESILKKLKQDKIDILGFNAKQREKKQEKLQKKIISIPGINGDIVPGPLLIEKYGYKRIQPMPWLYLYKKNFLIENKIEFHPGCFHEDCEFCLKSMCKAQKIAYIDKVLYVQRLSPNSTMRGINTKRAHDLMKVIDEIMRFISSLDCTKKVKKELYKYVSYLVWTSIKTCVEQGGNLEKFIEDNREMLPRLAFSKKYVLYLIYLCIINKKYKVLKNIITGGK